MPAPPLRSIGPRNITDRHTSFSSDHDENGYDFDAHAAKFSNKLNENAGVGTFKLADEAQMGGLSSLMVASDAKKGNCANNNNNKLMVDAMEMDDDMNDKGISIELHLNYKHFQ